jgi:hypothetical protein
MRIDIPRKLMSLATFYFGGIGKIRGTRENLVMRNYSITMD